MRRGLAGGCRDLVAGAAAGLGGGACQALLGGEPDDVPERYAVASPAALLPLGVPQLLVHGARDDLVPPAQSRDYAAAARAAGDTVDLVELPDADHFDVIEAADPAWTAVVDWLRERLRLDQATSRVACLRAVTSNRRSSTSPTTA